MGYYIDVYGYYYEGDQANLLDTAVDKRPSSDYIYSNSSWIKNKQKILESLNNALQQNLNDLTMQYAKALLADGANEETKIASIKAQQTALKSQYSADVLSVLSS